MDVPRYGASKTSSLEGGGNVARPRRVERELRRPQARLPEGEVPTETPSVQGRRDVVHRDHGRYAGRRRQARGLLVEHRPGETRADHAGARTRAARSEEHTSEL